MTMKQRPTTTTSCSGYDFGNHEIEVAEILVQLPNLIAESESKSTIRISSLSWGARAKRTRSTTDEATRSNSKRLRSSSQPLLPSSNGGSGGGGGSLVICSFKAEKPVSKVKVSSPATPLSFCPSESDEKPKSPKSKISYTKKIEKLRAMFVEYTRTNKFMIEELAKYKSYSEMLTQDNLRIRAIEQELKKSGLQEKVERSDQHQQHGQVQLMANQTPLIKDKASYNPNPYPYDNGQQTLASFPAAKSVVSHSDGGGGGGLGNMMVVINKNNVGTSSGGGGIVYLPDLNASLDPGPGGECFWMDFGEAGAAVRDRAMSAQARQRRIKICREKKYKSIANKLL